MRKQILAGAAALALATGMTTSAMAFSHNGGRVGSVGVHSGTFRAAGPATTFRNGGPTAMRSYGAVQGHRFVGVRGYNGFRHGGWGGRRFGGGYGGWGGGYPYYDTYAADIGLGVVGLGIGLADVATGYCDPYAYGWGWGAGNCGYGYGTPIDAWSY